MAKRARNGRGTGTGTKNPDRRNGKAWTKKRTDPLGRALTGRGKPSRHSVKGMKVTYTIHADNGSIILFTESGHSKAFIPVSAIRGNPRTLYLQSGVVCIDSE